MIYDVISKAFKEISRSRLMVFNSGHIRLTWGIKIYSDLGPTSEIQKQSVGAGVGPKREHFPISSLGLLRPGLLLKQSSSSGCLAVTLVLTQFHSFYLFNEFMFKRDFFLEILPLVSFPAVVHAVFSSPLQPRYGWSRDVSPLGREGRYGQERWFATLDTL